MKMSDVMNNLGQPVVPPAKDPSVVVAEEWLGQSTADVVLLDVHWALLDEVELIRLIWGLWPSLKIL